MPGWTTSTSPSTTIPPHCGKIVDSNGPPWRHCRRSSDAQHYVNAISCIKRCWRVFPAGCQASASLASDPPAVFFRRCATGRLIVRVASSRSPAAANFSICAVCLAPASARRTELPFGALGEPSSHSLVSGTQFGSKM